MRNSITFKFITGAVFSILGATLFAILYLLPQMKDDYMAVRQDAAQHLTEFALSQISELHRQAVAGLISHETAQTEALKTINTMRYGNKGYIWTISTNGIMLANPGDPQSVGKDMGYHKDSNGKPIFRQIIEFCSKNGHGVVSYFWPKPGESSPVEKISYAKLFQPWGWIVGTGIYVDEVDQNIKRLRTRILLAAALIFIVSTGAIYLSFRRFVTTPLNQVTNALEAIADGKSDLTLRLATDKADEFSRLSRAFNRFVDEIHETVLNVSATLTQVNELSGSAQESVLSIRDAANLQFNSLDDASAAVTRLNSSIKAITNDTSLLRDSAQGAAQATTQITGTINEITATSAALDAATDTIQGAVNQIASSLKQATANLVVLAQLTESATKSAANINHAVKDISASTELQADIAKDVQDAASTVGLGLVNSTRQGMERIRHEVSTTNQSIESLAAKSGDIGHIVGLISDIADETNLLALNAAILAAQAGPHGKAFAVVAEKVRALARRSTASTKDIAEIISQVQQEITMASKAVKQSITEVDKGIVTSADAERALQEIVTKTESSLNMALQVEASITLQGKNIELNASAVDNFRKMSQNIKIGVDKQSKAADAILHSVKELRTVSDQMKQAVGDQAQESEQMAAIITVLLDHARTTVKNTQDQEHVAEQMVHSFQTLKDQTGRNNSLSLELEAVTTGLNNQSALLRDKLAIFKITTGEDHDPTES